MSYRTATAPTIRHELPRGVYSQPYGNGWVYFYVTSTGREGYYRFQMEHETEDDIIEALGDEVDRVDPLPLVSPSVSWRFASLGSVRVLSLHRDS